MAGRHLPQEAGQPSQHQRPQYFCSSPSSKIDALSDEELKAPRVPLLGYRPQRSRTRTRPAPNSVFGRRRRIAGTLSKNEPKVIFDLEWRGADVDEVLGPHEVTQVREKLGLSQRAAGELLGGGPRAFQKYEAGKQAVSAPMSNLLRLLANDPTRVNELRADPKPRKSVRSASARKDAARGREASTKKRASGTR